MSDRAGLLRGLLSRGDGVAPGALDEVAPGALDPDEQVEYRLSGGDLSVSGAEESGAQTDTGSGGVLAAVTDRRLLLVTRSPDRVAADIPYTDLREIDLDSGFLQTAVTADVWEGATYRLSSVQEPATEAVAYASELSETWQFVDTLVDELEGYTARVERHADAGRFERAAADLADARETAAELAARVEQTDAGGPLRERVETASREVHRVQVQARLERAAELVSVARDAHLGAGEVDYAGARQRYESARDHLETAASLAAEHDFEAASAVTELRERLDRGLEMLAGQPVALATQAAERAVHTDHLEVRVETFRTALEHYRDAVALGWGTSLEPTRDRETLRACVALTAVGLVDARREYAAQLETAGDTLADWHAAASAHERYREAADQLEAALALAREFRVPDAGPVARDRERLAAKLSAGPDR